MNRRELLFGSAAATLLPAAKPVAEIQAIVILETFEHTDLVAFKEQWNRQISGYWPRELQAHELHKLAADFGMKIRIP